MGNLYRRYCYPVKIVSHRLQLLKRRKPKAMTQSLQIPEINEIKNGLDRVGLTLSDFELHELNLGNTVFLEGIELGKLGSVFILASAASAVNSGKTTRRITFQDLPKQFHNSTCCSGLSIFCWNADSIGKRCLYLTFVDGKPAIHIC